MKVYFAGVPGGGTSGFCKREAELDPIWDKRLWTYYWLTQDKGKMERNQKIELFLDSGAFSAWSQGAAIKIKDYINFIKKNKQYIDVYANLDVISLSHLRKDKVKAAKKTLANQRKMEKAGLNPLPVYHYGEPEDYLKDYVADYDYIAIGGLVKIPSGSIVKWLDHIFKDIICDEKGIPKVKVHAFGVTSLRIMLRYPWYSVDSTSWVITGRMGAVYVPKWDKNGNWIYNENSYKISVSNKSPNRSDPDKHISTLPPEQKNNVLRYINEKGFKLGESKFKTEPADYELKENERWAEKKSNNPTRIVEVIVEPGISNVYQQRDELNIIYFLDLEKSRPKWPWAFTQKTPKTFF